MFLIVKNKNEREQRDEECIFDQTRRQPNMGSTNIYYSFLFLSFCSLAFALAMQSPRAPHAHDDPPTFSSSFPSLDASYSKETEVGEPNSTITATTTRLVHSPSSLPPEMKRSILILCTLMMHSVNLLSGVIYCRYYDHTIQTTKSLVNSRIPWYWFEVTYVGTYPPPLHPLIVSPFLGEMPTIQFPVD